MDKTAQRRIWRVDYGYRKNDQEYHEDYLMVDGADIAQAVQKANFMLKKQSESNGMVVWNIYCVGMMGEPEEEVC